MLSHEFNEPLTIKVWVHCTNHFTISSQDVDLEPILHDFVHIEVCKVIDNGNMVNVPSILTGELVSLFSLSKACRGWSIDATFIELVDIGL